MSSETERITNEVLNRHHLGKSEERLGSAHFQDAESRRRTSNESPSPIESPSSLNRRSGRSS
jgi:hypothetical protein